MPPSENKQRCGALTASGAQCRSWARRGSDPPRCNVHGAGALPEDGQRRCAAVTAAGARCRAWAMVESDLCNVHAGLTAPSEAAWESGRACSAVGKDGRKCRAWAVRGSDPPLCNLHAGNNVPGRHAEQAGQRCEAVTGAARGGSKGARCRNWATRDTALGSGKALCNVHAGRFRMPMPAERRCVAKTLDGKRCRNWALPDEEAKGLCWLHVYPERHPLIRHSYYRRIPYFSEPVQAALARRALEGEPLLAELALVRLKLRELMAYFGREDLSEAAQVSATYVMYQGVSTVARLLKARKGLEEMHWKPATAGGAGQLLERIVEGVEVGD